MPATDSRQLTTWPTACACWLGGTAALIACALAILTDDLLAGQLMSAGLHRDLVDWFGGDPLPLGKLVGVVTGFSALAGIAGALRKRLTGAETWDIAFRITAAGWIPLCLLLVWVVVWYVGLTPWLISWSTALMPFALAICLALWSVWLTIPADEYVHRLSQYERLHTSQTKMILTGMVLLYVVSFTGLNWQLYWSLRLPHGDSAMYEEHLWNLTHGKGFRSYLDQGLFLGEHIQVIHVLLIPLHGIWPSQLLLELCESIALGICAVPVYSIAFRHSQDRKAALLLAGAVLIYFPLHFLDISIDLKTFRPIIFGVPLMLFAVDRIEQKKFLPAMVLLLLALSAKEDYAAVFFPLGLWMMWHFRGKESEFDTNTGRQAASATPNASRTGFWYGVGLAAFSLVYLAMVIKVFIPWFREGADVHYSRYFGALGNTPGDIVKSLFSRPGDVLARIFSLRTMLYALALLVPLGGLPLRSLSRLLVGLPLFGVLSLMQLDTDGEQMLIPFHHFHAPLVAILFWSAAAAFKPSGETFSDNRTPARFALWSAIFTAVVFSMSPLGLSFWDSHSSNYWQTRYVPDRRAEVFPLVYEQIPLDARVASTDFVHPRFTHHERSYDYSQYPRKVSGYEPRVPEDTDYIVIDTRHHYSWIHSPEDVPELRDEPEKWELLPDKTDGYFIILKRKDAP